MPDKIRVVTTYNATLRSLQGRPTDPALLRRVEEVFRGGRIELIQEPDAERQLEALEGADVFFCMNKPLPPGLFDRAKRLRLIQAGTVYGERIDIAAAARAGVAVSFFDRPITNAVADHAVCLMLALVRSLPAAAGSVRDRGGRPLSPARADGSAYNWTQVEGVRPLMGMRLGLFGFGDINRAIALRARGFGMAVRYWNRSPLRAWIDEKTGALPLPREELLASSDVLIPTVGLTPQTRGLIGERELRALPRGAFLVNVSRGPIVDHEALLRALREGHLAGAGLDVFDPEPFPEDHPLLRLEGVIPTPHLAGGDDATLVRELEMWFANVHRMMDGEPPEGIVNGVWRG